MWKCVGHKEISGTAKSVQQLATAWTVQGLNPGGRFSSPVQSSTGAHPASCTMSTGFLSQGKAAGV